MFQINILNNGAMSVKKYSSKQKSKFFKSNGKRLRCKYCNPIDRVSMCNYKSGCQRFARMIKKRILYKQALIEAMELNTTNILNVKRVRKQTVNINNSYIIACNNHNKLCDIKGGFVAHCYANYDYRFNGNV